MAVMEIVRSLTMEAAGDLSASQFRFVVATSADNTVAVVASAGANALGVLLNKPDAAGRDAEVAVAGRVKVVAGGTVAAGAAVQSDGSGDAITASTADFVLGTCLVGGAIGELIEVLLGSNHLNIA